MAPKTRVSGMQIRVCYLRSVFRLRSWPTMREGWFEDTLIALRGICQIAFIRPVHRDTCATCPMNHEKHR